MQHYRASGVYHMCLEQHFIDVSIITDEFGFGLGKVQAPVTQVLVYNIDGVVLKC
jgi:hypothetical protein